MQLTTNQSSASPIHPKESHQKTHWPSVTQFAFSILAALCFISTATLAIIGAAFQLLNSGLRENNLLPNLLIASALFFTGILLLISAFFSLAHLAGWSFSTPGIISKLNHPLYWLAILPIILLAGHLASQNQILALLLMPVFHILAISIPIFWLISIATKNLPALSKQCTWGCFTSGLALSPIIIIVIEIFALLGLVIVAAIYISSQPGLSQELIELSQRLMIVQYDPDLVIQLITPYLTQPLSIFALLAFGALIVPLIEELIKPIGVWFLAGYQLTPQQGFIAGILSGAGYALFESMALTSNVEEWSAVIIMRVGTAIIHITTTGLMGWALASAWRYNSFIQLGLTYLLAVSIHGLWNFNALMAVLSGLPSEYSPTQISDFLSRFIIASPLSLVFIMVGTLILLFLTNKELNTL